MRLVGSLAVLSIINLKIMSRLLRSLYQAIAVSKGLVLRYFMRFNHHYKTARQLCG